MQIRSVLMAVAVLVFGMAGSVLAKDWDKVVTLNAGGDTKEVTINRDISAVRLVWESGTVSIQTVVVRQGAEKTPYTVAGRLEDKAPKEVRLPAKSQVTGLRISDGGRGTYAVYVK